MRGHRDREASVFTTRENGRNSSSSSAATNLAHVLTGIEQDRGMSFLWSWISLGNAEPVADVTAHLDHLG